MADQAPPMSFREKTAWVSFVLLVAMFGAYFTYIAMVLAGVARNRFALFLLVLAAFVALEVTLRFAIATQAPRDAQTPKDEREQLIELKATRTAFYVLLVSAFASIGTMHLRLRDPGDHAWLMMQAILFSIVLAEAVKFARQIVLFRRDA
jgi:hypothetical protein